MNVLIIRSYPNKLNPNSYNIQEIGLAKALRSKNIDCDIVFYNGFSKPGIQTLDSGIKIYWLRGLNILKNGLLFGISKIIEDYDIIQVNEYDQLQSWILYTFSRKKLVIYHGPYYDNFNKGYNLKCKLFDTFFLPFSKNAKNNVPCITKSVYATDFLLNKGFKNVSTAGVGLDTDFLAENINSNAKFRLSSDNFNAVYVGKLEDRRNIEFLLNLATAIHKEFPSFMLTIVGKFDSAKYQSKIAPLLCSLKDSGIANYYESAEQNELSSLYSSADLFFFPSNYEIFGMVLLEAMYYGTVPISSANGGSQTLISDGIDGYIINGFDISTWKEKIVSLIQNQSPLKEMSSNAQSKIREHYTWDKIADKFIAIYHSTFS